jgi:hypothetical protein
VSNVSKLVILVVHGAVDEFHHLVAVVADAQPHGPGNHGGRDKQRKQQSG